MEMHPELVEFAKEADEQMARDYHEGFFRMSEKLRSLVCGTDVLSQVAAAELRKIAGNPVYESLGGNLIILLWLTARSGS